MKILDFASNLMSMSDEVWMRHSNPWSVWTRVPLLILFAIAIWSRIWIGWFAIIPIGVLIIWTWLNPRVFPKPRSTKNWASKGVFGEKIFVNRKKLKTVIPEHHQQAAKILTIISFVGFVLMIYGLYILHPWITAIGTTVAFIGKLWFVDRMVWLYEELKDSNDEFKNWEY